MKLAGVIQELADWFMFCDCGRLVMRDGEGNFDCDCGVSW